MKKNLKRKAKDLPELLPVSKKERHSIYIKSICVVLVLDYFFYRSVVALVPLSYIGYKYFLMEEKNLKSKKREEAKEQFKEMLILVSNGQRAGYSAENAFLKSYPELKELYGEDSAICKMLRMIRTAKENKKSLSEVWYAIGERTKIHEITEFSKVYDISRQKSGNVAGVMEKTAEIIVEKIVTEKEISVLISAKRLEQRIMNVMPFFIMIYIAVTSPGYFTDLYHAPEGVLIMSICMMVYLGAYSASMKIVDIKI